MQPNILFGYDYHYFFLIALNRSKKPEDACERIHVDGEFGWGGTSVKR